MLLLKDATKPSLRKGTWMKGASCKCEQRMCDGVGDISSLKSTCRASVLKYRLNNQAGNSVGSGTGVGIRTEARWAGNRTGLSSLPMSTAGPGPNTSSEASLMAVKTPSGRDVKRERKVGHQSASTSGCLSQGYYSVLGGQGSNPARNPPWRWWAEAWLDPTVTHYDLLLQIGIVRQDGLRLTD